MTCSMSIILKIGGAALLTAVVGLLLRRHNPETALLLGAVTALAALLGSFRLLEGLRDLRGLLRPMLGEGSEVLMTPVFKCLGIVLVSRFCSELCRDASQQSVAAAVEMAGSACCVSLVLPLLVSVLKILGGLM